MTRFAVDSAALTVPGHYTPIGCCLWAFVQVDPGEPAVDGRLAAVRDPARGGETVVRVLVERDGCCAERTVDAGNETDIREVVVLVGITV